MNWTVLSVAYPLAPVSSDAIGGAEQILSALDRALVSAGHCSVVVAQTGSRVAGTLIPVPAQPGPLHEAAQARAWKHQREAIALVLSSMRVDLIHFHGIDFHAYLPARGPPALVTLHLPIDWYPPEALRPGRLDTWFHAVSPAQDRARPPDSEFLPPIENGVPLDALRATHARRGFALLLGRICPEKGVHLAIEAAQQADVALLIAGEVFPYEDHQRYFEVEIRPRLDRRRRYIGPADFQRKRRLLNAARCLLVPSLAPETSSLVAREAAACGTPVIAFPQGALSETIEHDRTGFLVQNPAEMASAILDVSRIDPAACRQVARERFSLDRMIARYFETYAWLAEQGKRASRISGLA